MIQCSICGDEFETRGALHPATEAQAEGWSVNRGVWTCQFCGHNLPHHDEEEDRPHAYRIDADRYHVD